MTEYTKKNEITLYIKQTESSKYIEHTEQTKKTEETEQTEYTENTKHNEQTKQTFPGKTRGSPLYMWVSFIFENPNTRQNPHSPTSTRQL